MNAREFLPPKAWLVFTLAFPLFSQLVAPGQPVPRTNLPPVVLLNGHQNDCGSSSFASTFASTDQVLQGNGQVSLFFDSCSVKNRPSIEKLGSAFGDFVAALRYQDGTPVNTVDIVAHSMGGLIVRSYLSGKQEQDNTFSPPPLTHIRKAVFIATPHFGSGIAAFGFGLDQQLANSPAAAIS
ncbi:MAG: hypothetical protein M3Z09_00090 [Acidobacteriota bacterium]|nr:hypothetical protein [Acidobacteriota bacterium]